MRIKLTAAEAVGMDRMGRVVEEARAEYEAKTLEMQEEVMAFVRREGETRIPAGFRLEIEGSDAVLNIEFPPVGPEEETKDEDGSDGSDSD